MVVLWWATLPFIPCWDSTLEFKLEWVWQCREQGQGVERECIASVIGSTRDERTEATVVWGAGPLTVRRRRAPVGCSWFCLVV